MEMVVAAESAFGGMVISSRPPGDISDPPVVAMVAVEGEPTGVPSAVATPLVLVLGEVGLVLLQESKKIQPHNARAKLLSTFIFYSLRQLSNRATVEDLLIEVSSMYVEDREDGHRSLSCYP